MRFRWILCSLALLVSLGPLDTPEAAEQRCNELGFNCICSEPLNTNSYTFTSGSYHNPNDTTSSDKECSYSLARHPIDRNSATIIGSNDATVLSRLPAGHSVNYFMRANDGHAGIFLLGHTLSGGNPTARIAFRWYRFFSTNHEFKGDGVCENSKFAAAGPIVDITDFKVHAYDWTGFTNGVDCCFVGPNFQSGSPTTSAAWRGRWWRTEVVVRKRGTGQAGYTIQVYGKDVTNNGPELVFVNSSIPDLGAGPNPWTSTQATNLIPNSTIAGMVSNNYRQGTCNGFQGFSHFLVAGWDTDQGQRIGPSYEIEGKRPSAPGNLRIRP